MALITVSRELAALGDETAHELAKHMGYTFIDRHTLEDRIKSYGVLPALLEKYDERKPGVIASLSQERDDYLHYLKLAMFHEAAEHAARGCVFIGRGAYAIFSGIEGVLPVFLVSCRETRIERVRSYFRCDERKAKTIIDQSDRDRIGFHRYFFESDWKEAANYRVTLNTGHIHPSAAAGIIEQIVLQTVTAEMTANLVKQIGGAFLAQKVIHHILYERDVRVHFLDAAVRDGVATLYGVTNSKSVVEQAAQAAREVDGVRDIVQSIQVVEEYNMIH